MTEETTGKILVLIVEDEPEIRVEISDYVRDNGLAALEAESAAEALSILSSRQDVDVVFTDVKMPGSVDGIEFSRVVARKWPDIRLIMTSGMVRPVRRVLAPGTVFFPKPYDFGKLLVSIRALVA